MSSTPKSEPVAFKVPASFDKRIYSPMGVMYSRFRLDARYSGPEEFAAFADALESVADELEEPKEAR